MRAALVFLCVALWVGQGDAQASFLKRGTCKEGVVPISGFDRTRFSGRWYRLGGIRNPDEEPSVKCTTHDYSTSAVGMRLIAQGQDSAGADTRRDTQMNMADPSVARMDLTSNNRPVKMDVIATDYSTYACLVSCTTVAGTHFAQFAWILGREANVDKIVIGACQLALKDAGVPVAQLKGTRQGDQCTYKPLGV